MSSIAFGQLTPYDRKLIALKKQQATPVTLLNISKCNVPRICEELKLYGAYDDECESLWKEFKEIETNLWLADHRKKEAAKEQESGEISTSKSLETTQTTDAETKVDETPPAPETNRGTAGPSKYGGTVALPDWAWAAYEEETSNPGRATIGLSFQDIQSYSLVQLRQAIQHYNLEETVPRAKQHYKACETLMVKLVQKLADPTAKKMAPVVEEPAADDADDDLADLAIVTTATDAAVGAPPVKLLSSSSSTTVAKIVPADNVDDASASASTKQVKVRRGAEITYENCTTLSVFELRQELTRRDAFSGFNTGGGGKKINFKNMLRVLQALLLEDRRILEEKRAEEVWEKPEDIKARLTIAKAERKAEALQRSKERVQRREEEEAKERAAKLKEEEEEKSGTKSEDTAVVASPEEEGIGGSGGGLAETQEDDAGEVDVIDEVEEALWEKHKKTTKLF